MADLLQQIQAAPHAPREIRRRGKAAKIREMALKYPELPQTEIARRVGCSHQNVSAVLAQYLADTSVDDLRDYQQNQADVFDSLSHRLLLSVTPEKIAKAKVMEAITGAAILIDKARLVRGQATGINVNVLMDVVEAMRSRPAEPVRMPSESE